jgi:HPt (histidine-containing phosphotransfer) domain-containing protein
MDVPNDMMARYLERRKRDLEACLESFRNRNFNDLEKVGHQLKGNGLTFGHPELSFIGKKLENAAAVGDAFLIEAALTEFSHWVNKSS